MDWEYSAGAGGGSAARPPAFPIIKPTARSIVWPRIQSLWMTDPSLSLASGRRAVVLAVLAVLAVSSLLAALVCHAVRVWTRGGGCENRPRRRGESAGQRRRAGGTGTVPPHDGGGRRPGAMRGVAGQDCHSHPGHRRQRVGSPRGAGDGGEQGTAARPPRPHPCPSRSLGKTHQPRGFGGPRCGCSNRCRGLRNKRATSWRSTPPRYRWRRPKRW